MSSYYNLRKLNYCAFLVMFVYGLSTVQAQKAMSDVPVFGAQIFIEPGQTQADIDTWFLRLKENGMKTTRIRMFESYMHKPDGTWDYSLFDMAFKAAEKYDIKVYATLFPYTEKTDIGGFKFPRDEEHLKSISVYIEKLVTHFSRFKSMYGWVLINEPGVGGEIPENDFTKAKYREWLKKQIHPKNSPKKAIRFWWNLPTSVFCSITTPGF
jgi:beta-galactosidase